MHRVALPHAAAVEPSALKKVRTSHRDLVIRFDHSKLVKTHALVPVADGARQGSRDHRAALSTVDDNKVVAKRRASS